MLLSRPARSTILHARLALVCVALLTLLPLDGVRATLTLAKNVDVIGTVDCGRPTGQRCNLDDTLVLLTDCLTGQLAPAVVDISWIKDKLPALNQDDEITLAVEALPNGKLQALGVISAKNRTGTVNEGLSTGTREVTESRQNRGVRQDEDETFVRPAGGGVAGTLINQLTGAPIAGATVRVGTSSATTDAAGGFSIAGIPPGI